MELANSSLVKSLLKKAGVNPAPDLKRAHSPWGESFLAGKSLVLGGGSALTAPIAAKLQQLGVSLYRAPGSQKDAFAGVAHASLPDFSTMDSLKGPPLVLYDASRAKGQGDLDKAYEFFHGVSQGLSSNSRIVILSDLPSECPDLHSRTMTQAFVGFAKSLSKELGPKGSTVQLIQSGHDASSILRLTPLVEFFLSDYSAFITGQVIQVSTTAKDPESYELTGSLAGKTALVTGAAGGIGRETALSLYEEGAHVLCLDHPSRKADLEELATRIGGEAISMELGRDTNSKELEQIIRDGDGHVDILVHNAGITRDKTLKRMSQKQWQQVMSVNLTAIMRITEDLLKAGLVRDYGRIICTSSISGMSGNFGQCNYASTKAALIGFVAELSTQLGSRGITANCVAPGFIETPMTAKMPFMTRQFARKLASLSQGGLPVDIANGITFLASPSSQGINGSVLRICGGHLMGA